MKSFIISRPGLIPYAVSSTSLFKTSLKQTVWTQIRLLIEEQSDLGPHCLFAEISSYVCIYMQQMTSADKSFRCIFFVASDGLKIWSSIPSPILL